MGYCLVDANATTSQLRDASFLNSVTCCFLLVVQKKILLQGQINRCQDTSADFKVSPPFLQPQRIAEDSELWKDPDNAAAKELVIFLFFFFFIPCTARFTQSFYCLFIWPFKDIAVHKKYI